FDRAAAAQRAGPGRRRHCRRAGKPGTAPGAVTRPGSNAPGAACAALHLETPLIFSRRHFPACQNRGTGGALKLPTQSWADFKIEGGGEWDKTSEVPEVHGALRWWALSKAVKPHFSKQYWRAQAPSPKPAASMPEPPTAMPVRKPAITR